MTADPVAQVRRHLNDIPALVVEASHYLIPGTAPLDPTQTGKGKGSVYKIPIVPEIYDLLDDREKDVDDPRDIRSANERRLGVLPSLGLWVSLVFTELEDMGETPRTCCPPRAHTITGETNWLNDYAEPIVDLHPDFPADIAKLWEELRQACRIRKEYVPHCPYCGHRVEGVHGSPEIDKAPAWWRCTGCPKTWVHDAEIQRMAATQPPMTLTNIATWLNIPLRTLHAWRNQGRINPNSRGLYEIEHVRSAAKKLGREITATA